VVKRGGVRNKSKKVVGGGLRKRIHELSLKENSPERELGRLISYLDAHVVIWGTVVTKRERGDLWRG